MKSKGKGMDWGLFQYLLLLVLLSIPDKLLKSTTTETLRL